MARICACVGVCTEFVFFEAGSGECQKCQVVVQLLVAGRKATCRMV